MLVEHGRAGEAVGDALDEPEGGEDAEGAVRRLGEDGGDLVADVGQEAGVPIPATSRLNQRSVGRDVDPSWPTVSAG
jgi:hypothetical protein